MGAKASVVLNSKGNQDVWATMDRRNGFCGSSNCEELVVFRLLCNIARYRCQPLNDGVAIYRCNNRVNHEVSAFANKSRTTTSQGIEAFANLSPLVYVTTTMPGISTSLSIERNTPARLACIVCLIPPFGHRTQWRSRDSPLPVVRPHWGQLVLEDMRCIPKQGAPMILLIVALAVEAKTARSGDISESMIETTPWPE